MKKTLTLFLLLLAVAFTATAQEWEYVGTPHVSNDGAAYTVVKIDPSGTPYVAYMDTNDSKITVKKFNGASWVIVGNAGFSASSVSEIRLTFDTAGTPYVAYPDVSNNYRATVMKFDGTSWVNVGDPSYGTAYYISLAIDPSGVPYLAYMDAANNGYWATVKKFNGISWVTVGTEQVSTGMAYNVSLVIDALGTPYVAYMDAANNYGATVMTFNGTSWVTAGNAGFSPGEVQNISMAVDALGTPYVAYIDGAYGYNASVMKFDGTSWVTVGNAGFSNSVISYPALALDASGLPYVAYQDNGNGYKATVMKFNGTSWGTVGTGGVSANYASDISIAIDVSGAPYVGYNNEYGKATVMKFAEPVTLTLPQLAPAYCGITTSLLTDNLVATPIAGAVKYRFRVSDGATTNTVVRTDNVFRINMLPSYAYNTTYTIAVSVFADGVWGAFGPACTVTTPALPVTGLIAENCGITVPALSTNLYADAVVLATGYRFRVTNGWNVQTIDKNARYFRLNEMASYHYGTAYTIEVAVKVGGTYGAYGPACTVTTPLPVTQLNDASCGINAAFNTNLYATSVPLATGYRFRVNKGANVQIIEGTASYFRLNQLDSLKYNTTYTVKVAVNIDGTYGNYGPACTVKTPKMPFTQLRAEDCGTTADFTTNLYADAVPLAEGYRFKVTEGSNEYIIDRTNRCFKIKLLPSYQYYTTYTISVATLVNGVWSNYGPACDVTTSPAPGMRQSMANDEDDVRELTAFPNPFETSFTLAFETESNEPVTIQAYDITGKMLDNRTVSAEELSDLKIGENYASGIYSVIVTQGSYTKVVKMVKK